MKQVDLLLSTTYAKNWIEAFPIGNGHIGAMDSGNPHATSISLNDDSLWSGYNANHNKDVSPEMWANIRSAIDAKNFSEAERLVHDNVLSAWDDSYLPLGNINITRSLGNSSVDNYKRILDMSRSVQEVSFSVDNIAYKRTSFVSAVDDVYVATITTSLKDNADITLSSPLAASVCVNEANSTIAVSGRAPYYVAPPYQSMKQPVKYDNEHDTIRYYGAVKIKTDGTLTALADGFRIEGYTNITLIYSSNTSFRIRNKLEDYVNGVVNHASRLSFDRLLTSHVQDVERLYNRCNISLDFKSPDTIISTEDLMRKFGQDDSYLEAVVCLFNLGRYLTIASSREGTSPSNLQGIWNDKMRAPWCSNYTLNINTEMNYFGTDLVGLSECYEPLISFTKLLAKNGAETAKRTYNAGGFTASHNSDIWGHTHPVGGLDASNNSCVYGHNISTAGWLCSSLFSHFEFTHDIAFLADTAYPLMKEAARFYLDYMTVDSSSGYLVPSPSASPENIFLTGIKRHSLCKASTMDIAVIRELFREILVASDILNDNSSIIKEIEEALPRIYPYKVGKKGQLLEWYEEYKESDKHHRHISHLYALHPASEITPYKTPELAAAAATSLKIRGTGGTGWSKAWKINAAARLKNGDLAFDLIKSQLKLVSSNAINMGNGGSYKNMLCAHPPFQIDGNFGAMSGIGEMLLQSHDNAVELLPALPRKWANGSFKGLCARGGYVVSATWKRGKITEFEVQSNYKADVNVRINGELRVYATNKVHKL